MPHHPHLQHTILTNPLLSYLAQQFTSLTISPFSISEHILMPSNEHHEWLKKSDWLAVQGAMVAHDRNVDLLRRKYKERDEHGRLPHHWMAAKAQTHSHTLAFVGVNSICSNEEALTTRDNKGETPIDIARRSGACAEIIGLLSHTPEEACSLDWKGMARLYAPVAYWWDEMVIWIKSRSYADWHKFINEHDDELVREVLIYSNSDLLFQLACNSQIYTESLVFLALRMIHRHPLSLTAKRPTSGRTPILVARLPKYNACNEIQQVLSLDSDGVTSTPFPSLLRRFLPAMNAEIFSGYNQVCVFLRHTVSPHNNAVLVEVTVNPTVIQFAMNLLYDLNHNMSLGYSIVGQILSFLKPDPR